MMPWTRRLRSGFLPNRREVVCSAQVRYEQSSNRNMISTSEDHLGDYPFSEFQRDVERTIADQLPTDLSRLFGIQAEVRLIETRRGSLTVFFGVLLTGLTAFASYADFFDSMELVKQHCSRILASVLERKYQRSFNISVNTEFPRLRDPYDYGFPRRFRQGPFPVAMWPVEGTHGQAPPRRDAFFWFLLALCVALLTLVGVLVHAAVVQTYFPGATRSTGLVSYTPYTPLNVQGGIAGD